MLRIFVNSFTPFLAQSSPGWFSSRSSNINKNQSYHANCVYLLIHLYFMIYTISSGIHYSNILFLCVLCDNGIRLNVEIRAFPSPIRPLFIWLSASILNPFHFYGGRAARLFSVCMCVHFSCHFIVIEFNFVCVDIFTHHINCVYLSTHTHTQIVFHPIATTFVLVVLIFWSHGIPSYEHPHP